MTSLFLFLLLLFNRINAFSLFSLAFSLFSLFFAPAPPGSGSGSEPAHEHSTQRSRSKTVYSFIRECPLLATSPLEIQLAIPFALPSSFLPLSCPLLALHDNHRNASPLSLRILRLPVLPRPHRLPGCSQHSRPRVVYVREWRPGRTRTTFGRRHPSSRGHRATYKGHKGSHVPRH